MSAYQLSLLVMFYFVYLISRAKRCSGAISYTNVGTATFGFLYLKILLFQGTILYIHISL